MKPPLNFHQFIVKFFQPLNKRYRFLTISASLIIGIALYVGIDIGLAEVVRQNSYDMHMLATEQLNELGPGFANESKQYAEIIRRYTEHLEQRNLAPLLRVLYPTYSPKKALASLLPSLEGVEDEEEAKKAIWQAGVTSNQLYKLGKRFPRSPILWFKSEVVPDQLLTALDNALAESTKLTSKLENDPNRDAAIAACRANRKAILLLFLARLGYDNKEKIERFLSDVERARDCTLLLAERTVKNKKDQEFLYETARSENRRVKILRAMLDNNMDKVCDLLREAIEEAFEKEKGNTAEQIA